MLTSATVTSFYSSFAVALWLLRFFYPAFALSFSRARAFEVFIILSSISRQKK